MARRRLSRRAFLAGSGSLIVGFSMAGCSGGSDPASPTSAPAAPAQTPPATATPAPSAAPATIVAAERAEQAPAPPTGTSRPSSSVAAPVAAPSAAPTRDTRQRRDGVGAADQVDTWLAVDAEGNVTVYSGKVELGTGVATALAQIVAEELDVPVERVRMVMGDTAQTPDEGYTAGSKTIQRGGAVLRQAAAEARQALLALAAERLGAPVERLAVGGGVVSVQGEPARSVGYGALLEGRRFDRRVSGRAPLKPPAAYTVVGRSVPRVDLAGKATGAPSFVHDLRLPGMVHGRVVRPAGVGATLAGLDEASIGGVPGLLRVVRRGDFVGVVAEREEQAIRAARDLKVSWRAGAPLPAMADLAAHLRGLPASDQVLVARGDVAAALRGAARRLEATYYQPYQAHASVGPSCAVADVGPDRAVVWSSTQGVYQLRGALAGLLGLPAERVRVVHLEGAGCYGHNGADDVAADAALLSQAVGRPVRVQWMRHDEHAWEPYGPAMVMAVRGGLDARGNVAAWDYQVWSPPHTARPSGDAGRLLAAQLVAGQAPASRGSAGGGGRNAPTNYEFAASRVTGHWLATSPLRTSALRSLGAAANTFANESFMDELAAAAASDPVEFRLRHLADPRAIAVVRRAAELAGWQPRPSPAADGGAAVLSGRGIAFARYENDGAYVATVAEVEVDRASGAVRVRRVIVAHDCGLIINPDGVRNQVEGNVLQSLSRALKEEIAFDGSRVTSVDWTSYPILRFPEVPEVEVALLDRPDQPPLGAGEPATPPTAPAIANAIFDATGRRLRALPLTPLRE